MPTFTKFLRCLRVPFQCLSDSKRCSEVERPTTNPWAYSEVWTTILIKIINITEKYKRKNGLTE